MLISRTLVAVWLASMARAVKFNWNEIKHVYAFGDSYSFVQGTEGNPAFSFIGDAQHFAFTRQQLLTDEILPRNVGVFLINTLLVYLLRYRQARMARTGLNS